MLVLAYTTMEKQAKNNNFHQRVRLCCILGVYDANVDYAKIINTLVNGENVYNEL